MHPGDPKGPTDGRSNVIPVTRLDGSRLVINAELIEALEATPDTVVTLTTGRRLVVRESVDEIVARIIAYRRRLARARRRMGTATKAPRGEDRQLPGGERSPLGPLADAHGPVRPVEEAGPGAPWEGDRP